MTLNREMNELKAPMALDPRKLRQVFGTYPTGVTAVAALLDGRPSGLAANSFTSVSLDPPLVSLSFAHTSTSWPKLSEAPRLGISILAADQAVVCRRLAAKDTNRFADVPWRATSRGAVVLDGCVAWLECSIDAVHTAGDHDIAVLAVHEMGAVRGVAPLVFHASQFSRLSQSLGLTGEGRALDAWGDLHDV
jgi:flavin reductase (DIM6/NTAB) family NADH-FMN oxidoreductase RutF